MRKLKEILSDLSIEKIVGDDRVWVHGLALDSRDVKVQSMFFAIDGVVMDGHEFIDSAVENSAIAVVCEKMPEKFADGVTYVQVENTNIAMAKVANCYYDYPSQNINLVGVTGTNGKTTTVTLLYDLFRNMGYKTGKLTTIENAIDGRIVDATHTTPNSIELNQILADMVQSQCDYAFMEVSSHALDQNRTYGINFSGAVYTNLTHDHLDYHQNFSTYRDCKKILFDQLDNNAFALSNADDKNGDFMLQNSKATKFTYGLKKMADFKAKLIHSSLEGLNLNISGNDFYSKLVGEFNAYNLLAVYATAICLKQEKIDVLTHLSALNPTEGRFEIVSNSQNNIFAIIDYAHTPDALENVLKTINDIVKNTGKVISVFGCGGDRDKSKRPIMAKIGVDNSHSVILTSDNPRSEEISDIIDDMEKGIDDMHSVLSIGDRKQAIKTAIRLANPGDVVLVAGKGHEKYQMIKGVKYPFDDKKIVQEIISST